MVSVQALGDGRSVPREYDPAIPIVPLRHPWRLVGTAIVLVLLAMFVNALVTEEGFEWDVVGHYLFEHEILDGVLLTLELTAAAIAVGLVLGLILAVCRTAQSLVLSYAARTYISVFRAVPVLVQMVLWYNLAALIPEISIGIPFGPSFASASATSLISSFTAATLGLGLAEAAYMAEIFRGGLASVPEGQLDAARAIGMPPWARLRHVVLPQAMKAVIPPIGNQVIGMMKYTSLASVIAVTELLQAATLIYSRTFETIPLLIVASLWYMALTFVMTIGQRAIERHYGRGTRTVAETSLVTVAVRTLRARRSAPSPTR